MANIKFSQFTEKTTLGTVDFLVGYTGAENVQISPTNLLSTFVSGSGTNGQVAYFDPSNNLTGENDFFWDYTNNRLGIGTSSPSRTLHVKTDSGVLIKGASGSVNAKISLVPASGGRQYDLGNVGSDFRIFDSSAGVTRMYFDNDGNTGIGTTTPSSTLQISGTLDATGISQLGSGGSNVYLTSSSAGNVGIGTSSPANKLDVKGVIGIQRTVNTDTSNINMEGNFNFVAASGYSHRFEQAGTEVARILPSGNVGIGTTSPTDTLTISNDNNLLLGLDSPAGNDAQLRFYSAGNYRSIIYRPASSSDLRVNTVTSGDVLTIQQDGNVGIGNTSPVENLQITDDTGADILLNSNANAANSGIYLTEGINSNPKTNGAYVYYSGAQNQFRIATGGGTFTDRLTIDRENGNATFAGGVTLESGTNGTTNKLIFKTTDNADTSKFIRSNEYYLEFGSNKNEGFKFTDVQFGTTLLQINGGNNSSGNGFNSATFAGDITANSIFLPDNRDIGWNGGYSASKPTLAAVGTTMKMFPSGNAASAQFTLSPTIATFGGTVLLQGDGGNAQKYLAIYNEGTATHDDVVLGFKTHGSRQYSIGIDRSTTNFTLSNLYASVSSGVLLSVDNSGNAIFTGDIQVGGWVKGVNATNTLYSATSLGTYLQSPTNSGTGSNIYFRNTSGTVFQTFSQVAGGTSTFAGNITVSTASATLNLLSETNGNSTINFADPADNNVGQIIYRHNGNSMAFDTNDVERMRIDSSGNASIGSTTNAGYRLKVEGTGTVQLNNRTGSDGAIFAASKDGAIVGSITVTSSATAFNTSSDYRLKEDLQDFAGLDMVSKISVYDFKWKADESRSYGVMAHELQEVLPQAVTEEKDAEEMQGVDYSKIVPLLVKSIQELKSEIEELKSK